MISLLVTLVILAIVFGLFFWVLGLFPIPQPVRNIILAIVVVVLAIYLISLLTSIGGSGIPHSILTR